MNPIKIYSWNDFVGLDGLYRKNRRNIIDVQTYFIRQKNKLEVGIYRLGTFEEPDSCDWLTYIQLGVYLPIFIEGEYERLMSAEEFYLSRL